MKTFTVRLEEELADTLRAVCLVDEETISDVIKTALARYFEDHLNEDGWEERKAAKIQKMEQQLTGLKTANKA